MTHGAVRRTDGAPPPSLPPNRASPKIAPSHGSIPRLSFPIGPLPRLHTTTVRSLKLFSIVFSGSRERGIRVEGARGRNASRVFLRKTESSFSFKHAALERPLDFFFLIFQLSFFSPSPHHFRFPKLLIRITRACSSHSSQGALFVVSFPRPLAHSPRVALLLWSCHSSSVSPGGRAERERERLEGAMSRRRNRFTPSLL